jgi:hypothetical protein
MTALASLYKADEIPKQIEHLRDRQIPGWILFRAANISQTATQGLPARLANDMNRYLCLTPSMHWKNQQKPSAVKSGNIILQQNGYLVKWQKSIATSENEVLPRFYGIYEIPKDSLLQNERPLLTNTQLIRVTSDTFIHLPLKMDRDKSEFFITAISPNSIQSEPFQLTRQVTSVRELSNMTLRLEDPFPNPSDGELNLSYNIIKDQEVSVNIYSLTGQHLATLLNRKKYEKGEYSLCFNLNSLPKPGMYLIILEGKWDRIIKKWVSY